ncbi:MAG: hypothetical protein CM15mP69_4710 [Ectothiorhodospiraceae bacterium]|nr:MAG: hypothetical protein CM15mP69_4710 [Ectothiorhodospiraceae bacterium]
MGVKSIFFAFVTSEPIRTERSKIVREGINICYTSIITKVKNMKLGIIGGSGYANIGNIDKEEQLEADTWSIR